MNEPVRLAPGAVCDSYSELQSEFRAIKESVAKIKLPSDLVVGDSRSGISSMSPGINSSFSEMICRCTYSFLNSFIGKRIGRRALPV